MLDRKDLHGYQNLAVEFMCLVRRCFLTLDLGLGKTVSTLTAISDLIDSFEVKRVLVVAPLRVAKKTWPDEIKKWAHFKHLTYSVICGDAPTRKAAMKKDVQIHIINVENLQWLYDQKGRLDYDMIVLDESSMYKNRDTQRFRYARKLATLASRVVLMSATPAPNGYLDLWGQVFIIDGGQRLGPSKTEYQMRYFKQLDRDGYKFALKKGAAEIVQKKLRDIMLTMKAEDYLKMPKRFDLINEVELSENSQEAYDNFEEDMVQEFIDGKVIEATSAAAVATKLMQYANGRVYDSEKNVHFIHDEKIEELRRIVEETNEPLFVAYAFKSDRDAILKAFPDAVALEKDMRVIDRWNEGKIKMLVAHPASAGHGLNLQDGGRRVVWYGLTYSLELYLQFNARLYRQGQRLTTYIHHIVAKGTIDELILGVLRSKNATQEGLLQAMKGYVARLSDRLSI
jgi:SNF2 family DNA or RNA helicase